MKRFLATLCLILPSIFSIAQFLNTELYLYPGHLVKIDTSIWEANTYKTFLNSVEGFAELKNLDNPAINLMVKPMAQVYDTVPYRNCKCSPEYFDSYPRYQKVLHNRRLIIGQDTVYIAVNQSHEKVKTFHIAACRRETFPCLLRISVVGPVEDSVFIRDQFTQTLTGIRKTTPAEMDKAFGLPLTSAQLEKAGAIQQIYYDKVLTETFLKERERTNETDRNALIASIQEAHRNNYEPIGWTKLPDLTTIPLDSLVRIKVRYYSLAYIGGSGKIRLASNFFPPGFTFQLYKQSLKRLVTGDLTFDDFARYYFREQVTPGHPFYYSRLTSSSAYHAIHSLAVIKRLFPSYEIVNTNPPSISEGSLVFSAYHKVSDKKRAEGYVVVSRKKNQLRKEVIPPLWVTEKDVSLDDIAIAGDYRIRALKDWSNDYTYQKKKIYLLDHERDSSFWISYSLPVQNDSTYLVTFQFSGSYEDTPVLNMRRWKKVHPHDNPDDYYKAVEVKAGEDTSAEFDKIRSDRDKLFVASTPNERLYTYTHLVHDIDGDRKDELISFSVSDGKMIFYKCFTNKPSGLHELKGDKIKALIRSTDAYKKLAARSVLKADVPE